MSEQSLSERRALATIRYWQRTVGREVLEKFRNEVFPNEQVTLLSPETCVVNGRLLNAVEYSAEIPDLTLGGFRTVCARLCASPLESSTTYICLHHNRAMQFAVEWSQVTPQHLLSALEFDGDDIWVTAPTWLHGVRLGLYSGIGDAIVRYYVMAWGNPSDVVASTASFVERNPE